MKRILVTFGLLVFVVAPVGAEPPHTGEPRLLLRVDAGLLMPPNVGAVGSGGGIEIPLDGGSGAGLLEAAGAEIGCEVRLSHWLALDVGAGWYAPRLEVARGVPGATQPIDDRSASVELRLLDAGLVVAPPRLRRPQWRLGFGVLAVRSSVSGAPSSLGLSVDANTGIAVDARGDFFPSKSGHWGIGMALVFSDVGPRFTDLETGTTGGLQVSGFFLRLGLRRRF